MSNDPSRLRASDEDRSRAAEALSHAFAQGKLDYAEFDERTSTVWATKYRDELLLPLADLYPDPARVLDRQLPAVRPDHTPPPSGPRRSAPTGARPWRTRGRVRARSATGSGPPCGPITRRRRPRSGRRCRCSRSPVAPAGTPSVSP